METAQLIEGIATLDRDGVRAVQDALSAHSRYLRDRAAALNKARFVPGSRVVTVNLRPKYLNGLHGEVTGAPARRKGDIQIQVDEACRTYQTKRYIPSSGMLGIPAASLIRESEA